MNVDLKRLKWYLNVTLMNVDNRILTLFLGFKYQLATNTLERVAPLTHAVGNVLKRVFVIGFSIVIFGNDAYLLLSFYRPAFHFLYPFVNFSSVSLDEKNILSSYL